MADCTACHATMPTTVTGGPHGMHPVGQNWVATHKNNGQSANCQACHGTDDRGTVLSRMFANRTLQVTKNGVTYTVNLWRGQTLSRFVCHKREDDGRLGGVFTTNHPPVATSGTLATARDTAGQLTLGSSDADGNPRTLRIVQQPQHGAVALAGTVATYHPETGFVGPDAFTFAAFDGFSDSNLGVISVTVNAPGIVLATLDTDGDRLPDLVEYTLGLTVDFPTVYPPAALETFGGTPYLTLALPRGIPPPDATATIEVSGDLHTWTPATVVAGGDWTLKAHDTVPANSADRRFIRIGVSR